MSSNKTLTQSSTPTTSPTQTKLPEYLNDSEYYEDINVVKLLSKAKFPVYLAFSPAQHKNFALKVFEFEDGNIHPYFKNEVRFARLDHPNVIKIAFAEEITSIYQNGKDDNVSCILMEYAPYGDFFDFVKQQKRNLTDKLVRTYFKQLIEGLEYLHKNGVCHLDLKLENLLLGEDYLMKIADFDLSYVVGDSKILTKGTKFYRAPELRATKCRNGVAADIYAAGIILFVMKCGGVIPHAEDSLFQGVNLLELLNTDGKEFFKKHCNIQKRDAAFFDADFQKLFLSMVHQNPDKRATLKNIKKSRWFNGPTYSNLELKDKMKRMLNN